MRCFEVSIAVLLLGCSGGGVSTTARGSFGDTDDSAMESSTAPMTTDPSTSGEPPVTTSGTSPMTTTDPASTSDMPMTEASGEPATDTMPMPVMLEGAWVSEGDDVAPILENIERIDAVFADGTFTVTSLDTDGNEVVQAGVYTTTASDVGEIYEIVLEQSSPQATTAEGIYEIDNSTDPPTMTYEVVQTMPSVGAVAPTPEGGFGSTALGADLTQRYVRL
jgi:hypothetical protein